MAVNTALIEVHKELDAKMAPVNGWNMPLFYPGGAVAEHRFCRSECGIFDGGNRKIWQFNGDIAGLDDKFSTPVSTLNCGMFQDCMLLAEQGGIKAVYTVCRMAENDLLAIAAPGCEVPFHGGNDLSGVLSSFTLLGKKAAEVLAAAAGAEIPENGRWQKLTFVDENEEFRAITLSMEKFGEQGFEFIFNAEYAADLYDLFYRNVTVHPAGLHAYESLRIESGTPAWGSEWSAGLSAGNYLVTAKLGRHPVKPGSDICDAAGNVIGKVTGSAFCPSDECAKLIGMTNCHISAGTVLFIGDISATVL